jgi:hypothetical protein
MFILIPFDPEINHPSLVQPKRSNQAPCPFFRAFADQDHASQGFPDFQPPLLKGCLLCGCQWLGLSHVTTIPTRSSAYALSFLNIFYSFIVRSKPKTVDKYLKAKSFFLSDAFCNAIPSGMLQKASTRVVKSDSLCRTMQRVFVAKCNAVAKCNLFLQ